MQPGTSANVSDCQPAVYTGLVCLHALQSISYQDGLLGNVSSGQVFIASDVDQEAMLRVKLLKSWQT